MSLPLGSLSPLALEKLESLFVPRKTLWILFDDTIYNICDILHTPPIAANACQKAFVTYLW